MDPGTGCSGRKYKSPFLLHRRPQRRHPTKGNSKQLEVPRSCLEEYAGKSRALRRAGKLSAASFETFGLPFQLQVGTSRLGEICVDCFDEASRWECFDELYLTL
eukprot:CAMPEP_0178867980 /NCGR_PEP_ID=MMETSP0747-20121128/5739_1 /TAXON_ID=913974 /ORGANISM="Nitzschia punctata, Strain CCMP561" /LENGTH=103 /DNA_ID=CAMNT_0020534883 /DNA_START=250 /DNA_END=558 /DNA_ORIENTATION=+